MPEKAKAGHPGSPEDLRNRFTYHPPIEVEREGLTQPERYGKIRTELHKVASMLTLLVPQSRELSRAINKLEEAGFLANAGIARNEGLEEEPGIGAADPV